MLHWISRIILKNLMESNFRNLILDISSQIKTGLESAKHIKLAKKPDQIIICGMGGSAFAGEFLKSVFNDSGVAMPLYLHKDYDLPLTISKNSIIVCASYSGNTEETISAYKKAKSLKLKTIAMASGGLLEKLARKDKAPFIEITAKGIPPRLTVLFMFSAMVKLLVNSNILSQSAESQLKSAAKNLKIEDIEGMAHDLSKMIGTKTPLIYSSGRLNPLAYFLKISFNENAKIHAFSNVLPECQHNEIQGFYDESLNERFYSIFLEDSKDNKRIATRIKIMSEIIAKRNFDFSIINLSNFGLKNVFEKIFFTLFLGGFSSLSSAELKNQDPLSVPLIDELKNALAKK